MDSRNRFSTRAFEQKVGKFIGRHRMLRRDIPLIVALSGGADSVCLLAVLTALGYDCRAAHCNFHLRGEESMRDMRFCRELAERLDVDLYIRDFNVAERMSQTGESVEMACRELRYRWFEDLLDRDTAQAVAVGHHREDRAETFMLNLMRGTGIAGLTAMNPVNGSVVRPLLEFSRDEIELYLAARGLEYITDSSNASDAHRRNRLRNTVFPQLEECFPGATDAVLRTIDNLVATREIYRRAVENLRQRYVDDRTGRVDLASLSAEPQAATLLFEFLRDSGFTYSQACDMLASAGESGLEYRNADGSVVIEQSHGELVPVDAAARLANNGVYPVNLRHDVSDPLRIAVSIHPVEAFAFETKGPHAAFFDADIALAEDCRWELRHYVRGDRMVPFGGTKSKLLSDFFANAKFSAAQKRAQWVLTCNGTVAWLPGLRNSAFAAVGPDTKRYLSLKLYNQDV